MDTGRMTTTWVALLGGISLAISASSPASAQFACAPGYYYVPGYGCELPNSTYVLPEYEYVAPPVVPFSFYDGRWNRRRDRDDGFRGRDGFGHGDPGHGIDRDRR